ncbi:MAG: cell wall hydrolase [Clostridiales bacterium]|nr:cell wall hydrolase [Clostridiales bacterium]
MSKRLLYLLLITVFTFIGCGKAAGEDPGLSSAAVVVIPEKHYKSAITTAPPCQTDAEILELPTPVPTPRPTEIPRELVDNLKPTPTPTPTPTPKPTPVTTQASSYYTVYPGRFTDDEIYLVARFITCEARYAGDEGQRSVASVVLNRVFNNSGRFPDTVEGVLFQRNQFVRRDKLLSTEPTEKALRNARYVFRDHGSTLPKKVLFYKAAYLGTTWEDYMEYYKTIEGNCFFYGKYYF